MSRVPVVRILKLAGIVLAGLFFMRSIRAAWAEVSGMTVSISWGWAIAAVLALTSTYLAFAWLWRRIAKDLGTHVAYGNAVQLWAFSNLGRYLPGKVWQVVGLVLVARDLGVSGGLAASVAVVALAFTITTGALLAIVLVPAYFAERATAWVFAIGAAGVLIIPLSWPKAVSVLLRWIPVSRTTGGSAVLTRADTARLTGSFLLMWLAHGATFMLLVAALVDVEWHRYLEYTGAYALSHVAGILAIFAPGGIGVRENALAHVLQTRGLHPESANVIALLARVWTIVGEAMMVVIAVLIRRRSTVR